MGFVTWTTVYAPPRAALLKGQTAVLCSTRWGRCFQRYPPFLSKGCGATQILKLLAARRADSELQARIYSATAKVN